MCQLLLDGTALRRLLLLKLRGRNDLRLFLQVRQTVRSSELDLLHHTDIAVNLYLDLVSLLGLFVGNLIVVEVVHLCILKVLNNQAAILVVQVTKDRVEVVKVLRVHCLPVVKLAVVVATRVGLGISDGSGSDVATQLALRFSH